MLDSLSLNLCGFSIFQEGQNVDVLPSSEQGPGKVDPSLRITTPYLTKYERARVLGTRALQIAWVDMFIGNRKARFNII